MSRVKKMKGRKILFLKSFEETEEDFMIRNYQSTKNKDCDHLLKDQLLNQNRQYNK